MPPAGIAPLRRLPPPAWVPLSFALLIAAGTLLLRLPAATPAGQPLGWIDAVFTSTSAASVTGLAVRDTGTGFTGFGQAVILGLIQVGGLGVVTFALLFVVLGGRVSLDQRQLVEHTLAGAGRLEPRHLLRLVFALTLACEAAGTVWLYLAFRGELPDAGWQALFHAVSAFCNAGFSLLPDSLARFGGHAGVNLGVMALVVAGGLGFLTIADLAHRRLRWARLTLHSRLVLVVSGFLIAAGAATFWAVERGGALADRTAGEQLWTSLFQSVSARTAGFQTLDLAELAPATLLGLIVLMYVGGSPGSCAGGIKTTTAATMLLALRAELAGRRHVNAFGRTLPRRAVAAAFVMVSSFLLAANAGLFALLLVEAPASGDPGAPGPLDYAFEAMSALGTVGLSTGVTPTLAPLSRLVLVALMLLGRVGPLTLAAILAGRRVDDWQHPSETVMIG